MIEILKIRRDEKPSKRMAFLIDVGEGREGLETLAFQFFLLKSIWKPEGFHILQRDKMVG